MKKSINIILLFSALVFAAGTFLLTACSLTDTLGLTQQTSVEVVDQTNLVTTETTRNLTPEAEAGVDALLNVGASSGGLVGVVSTGLVALWALFKARKASNALKVAVSVVSGVSAVLAKIAAVQASGGELQLSEQDVKDLLKAAQNDAGTREAVRALLAKNTAPTGALGALWEKLKNAIA